MSDDIYNGDILDLVYLTVLLFVIIYTNQHKSKVTWQLHETLILFLNYYFLTYNQIISKF